MTSIPHDTQELVDFAISLGLKEEWLQTHNKKHIHYDISQSKVKEALDKGATLLSIQEYVTLVQTDWKKRNNS